MMASPFIYFSRSAIASSGRTFAGLLAVPNLNHNYMVAKPPLMAISWPVI
jgi:hypothetical protein